MKAEERARAMQCEGWTTVADFEGGEQGVQAKEAGSF